MSTNAAVFASGLDPPRELPLELERELLLLVLVRDVPISAEISGRRVELDD